MKISIKLILWLKFKDYLLESVKGMDLKVRSEIEAFKNDLKKSIKLFNTLYDNDKKESD